MTGLDLILTIVAVILMLVGISGCIIPGLPGTPLAWFSLLAAFFVSKTQISITSLVITALVTIAAEIFTNVVPSYFTKISGGTKWGSWGATIGVFVGVFTGQILLVIFGSFLGALIGEIINNHQDIKKAFKSALYAFLGFITGSGLCLIISIIFAFILVTSYFPKKADVEEIKTETQIEQLVKEI